MSGAKWGLKKLGNLRQKINHEHIFRPNDVVDGIGDIPITWHEYNKMYFSSRPVVVECPCGRWQQGDQLMAFYATMRQVFTCRKVGIFSTRYDAREATSDSYYEALWGLGPHRVCLPKGERLVHLIRNEPTEDKLPTIADDWIMYSFGATPTQAESIMKVIDESDGFKKWDDEKFRRKSFWEVGPKKKVVILAGRGAEDIYPKLKEKWGKRFVFIDYTPEKELVDNWYVENKSIVDPMFDILISEPYIDKRKVFLYVATNHLYNLREYVKLFPEVVGNFFTMNERIEFGL